MEYFKLPIKERTFTVNEYTSEKDLEFLTKEELKEYKNKHKNSRFNGISYMSRKLPNGKDMEYIHTTEFTIEKKTYTKRYVNLYKVYSEVENIHTGLDENTIGIYPTMEIANEHKGNNQIKIIAMEV